VLFEKIKKFNLIFFFWNVNYTISKGKSHFFLLNAKLTLKKKIYFYIFLK